MSEHPLQKTPKIPLYKGGIHKPNYQSIHNALPSNTNPITNKGLYRYKRLMFGISSAPQQYQNVFSYVFHDINGVENISDDNFVHGATQQEHDERLNSEQGLHVDYVKRG